MIQAVLTNSQHPEYGVVTVPFPIPKKEYYHVMELLAQLGIGDPVARDCNIEEISGDFPARKYKYESQSKYDAVLYFKICEWEKSKEAIETSKKVIEQKKRIMNSWKERLNESNKLFERWVYL